jgi:hypothetical protein
LKENIKEETNVMIVECVNVSVREGGKEKEGKRRRERKREREGERKRKERLRK